MSAETWNRLQRPSHVQRRLSQPSRLRHSLGHSLGWLAALSLGIACADDGASTPGDTDTEGDTDAESSTDPSTVTVTSADTSTSATTTTMSTGESSSTEPADTSSSSESGDPETSSSESGDVCGNGAIDDGEECDGTELGEGTCESLGFDDGDVACAADCTYDTTACVDFSCGDGIVSDGEQCDGTEIPTDCIEQGFGPGTLSCTNQCMLDFSACCGDDNVGGTEVCDGDDLGGQTCADQVGFDGGVLACNADCGGFDVSSCTTCGDAVIEGTEDCEGDDLAGNDCTTLGAGFVSGTLACTASCGFDTSACSLCGNDTLNAGEQCDGAALGGMDCLDIGFTGGTLGCFESCLYDTELCTNFPPPGMGDVVINEIMRNPNAIPDASGEWFEIVNTSLDETYQLLGCTFQDDGGDDFAIDIDLTIGPGEILTFANNAAPGFTPDFVYAGMNLANSDDEIELVCNAVSVDRVAYDAGGGAFPSTAGHAMQLDPASQDAMSNDDGLEWCDAFTPYFMSDAGTPGSANDSCELVEFTIDFCRLQFPTTIDDAVGADVDAYGRVFIDGQTDLSGVNDPNPSIVGYVGYGPDGSDPAIDATWVWTLAAPNGGYGPASPDYEANNDEYVATMTLPAAGTYDFAYRFSGDGGDTFTYCDAGNGSSDGYAAGDAGQLTTTGAGGDQAVLYFSEYHEGTSNFKGLEIANPSDDAVDLTGCVINQYFNGAAVAGTTTMLSGNVGANDVFTMCHSTLDAVVVGGCDDVVGWQFSGNDAVELVCGGTTNDVIGQIGNDPGAAVGWTANGVSTLNTDIRRDCAFQDGDANGADAFDPSVEWDAFPLGGMGHTVDDFGLHACP